MMKIQLKHNIQKLWGISGLTTKLEVFNNLLNKLQIM